MFKMEDADLHVAFMKKFKIKSMVFEDGTELKISNELVEIKAKDDSDFVFDFS